MDRLPDTWIEVRTRMAAIFGGGAGSMAVVDEWIREAVEVRFGVQDVSELPRARRALALQRMTGVLLAIEDESDLAFAVGVRKLVAAIFARYFDGVALDGPPWRLDPLEADRVPYDEWRQASSFDELLNASASA